MNPKTVLFLGYPKVIPYISSLNTFISFIFELGYAADKQTDKQTDSKILLMPTDIVSVGNNNNNSHNKAFI